MTFAEYIKGKRVVFVGAATILQGRGTGKEIDGFDVVVRTNGAHNIRGQYAEDYGSRTDVLYLNNQHAREMRPLPVARWAKEGIRWLCFKSLSTNDLRDYSHYIPCRDIHESIKRVNEKVYGALMGRYLLDDLISCSPLELHVTGIDFFVTKNAVFVTDDYHEYLDGYLPPKIVAQGNIINQGKTEDGHNMKANTQFIYELMKAHPNMTMPEYIQDIMMEIV